MKYILVVLLCFSVAPKLYSQPGSATEPFIALGNARTVTVAGVYYFNLDGTAFSTYVNESGMVLVATDYISAPTGALPQVTALTNSGQGILTPAVLARLTSANLAAYTTSNNVINVTNSDAGIINRITANQTIHIGMSDVSLNSGWTGTGQSHVRPAASCNTTSPTNLHQTIHHPCGSTTGFHWIPVTGVTRDIYNNAGPAGTRVNLWVQASLVALPVTLSGFTATVLPNQNVELHWKTLNELNSSHFVVERSAEASNWIEFSSVPAQKNAVQVTSYTVVDRQPFASGTNFYRLKMLDLDGTIAYSDIVKVEVTGASGRLHISPNPSRGVVYLTGEKGKVAVFNSNGVDVSKRVNIQSTQSRQTLDFSSLPKGIYFVRGERAIRKLLIE